MATANTNIKINIVEPGTPPSPTPVDPVAPNTGLFTHGIGGPEATAIVSVVLVLAIASIVLTAYMYRRNKKAGKVTKLVHIIDSTKAVIKSKKRISSGLAAIALLVSAGTFIALAKNGVNASEGEEQATEDANNSSLTVTESSQELTVEVSDSPVFAVLPVEVTVEEATVAGYTLTAFTDSTDLVSTTNPDNIIPMVTLPESPAETLESSETADELTPLTDNTYGLSLSEPTTKDEAIYTALSTDSSTPTLITDKAYEATEENDTTTIYYGFYITPDVPKGTYVSNSEVVYDAIPNLATVTFDANGLYYNNDESLTTNTIGYKPNVAEAPIELVTGEYLTPAPLNPDSSSSSSIHYTFLGWSEDKDATEATYVDEEDILANLTLTKNESLTLYAVWHYNTVLSFNGTTSDGGTPMEDITIPAGNTITLPDNTYTKDGYHFTGWNTQADGEGEPYAAGAEFTATQGETKDITLYAQWEEDGPTIGDLTYMQDFASLNEADKASILNSMTEGEQYQLKDNRDQKDYYISKLADGKVWMTQNLDLQKEDLKAGVTLDSTNTDHPASGFVLPNSQTSGNIYWYNSSYKEASINSAHVFSPSDQSGYTVTDLGNYYNWYSATAGTGTYSLGDGEVATGSICPAGWRLPNNSSNGSATDYSTLLHTYGVIDSDTQPYNVDSSKISSIFESPLSLVRAGGYGENRVYSVGYYGFLWSSMARESLSARYFDFSSTSVNPLYNSDKAYGCSVRCVAE